MKLFKTLYIGKVDYTGVPHHKTKGWNGTQKRYINRLYIHDYADEARLTVALEEAILKQCRWLTDWLYSDAFKPAFGSHKPITGTKLMLAIGRVAEAKVRKDWGEYASAILNLNTLYIYALEARYGQPCGYTDSTVVIGDNMWGWRNGAFIPPKDRPFGRLQSTPNHRGSQ
tara:strand:- start:81 stop:593 length:513 start_codon:yes stop_codon:yes gene_type:complete